MDSENIPKQPSSQLPMGAIRAIAGGIIIVSVLFFLSTVDREAILVGRPHDFDDLLIAVVLYTFPLALGSFLITFIANRVAAGNVQMHPLFLAPTAVVILFACGVISSLSGLGRPPDYTVFTFGTYTTMVGAALSAYRNTYGLPLLICGITAGVYLALEVEAHL